MASNQPDRHRFAPTEHRSASLLNRAVTFTGIPNPGGTARQGGPPGPGL